VEDVDAVQMRTRWTTNPGRDLIDAVVLTWTGASGFFAAHLMKRRG